MAKKKASKKAHAKKHKTKHAGAKKAKKHAAKAKTKKTKKHAVKAKAKKAAPKKHAKKTAHKKKAVKKVHAKKTHSVKAAPKKKQVAHTKPAAHTKHVAHTKPATHHHTVVHHHEPVITHHETAVHHDTHVTTELTSHHENHENHGTHESNEEKDGGDGGDSDEPDVHVKPFVAHHTSLKAGEEAPFFSGPDQRGKTISLHDFRSKTLVLYFYPKDDTDTCTIESCSLRDEYSYLNKHNYAVVGVSADDTSSHARFADKHNLPFPLIADTGMQIIKAYDVWGTKQLFGHIYDGIVRTTFVIRDGKILRVISKVDAKNHGKQVMEGE